MADVLCKEPAAILPNSGYKIQHFATLKMQLEIMQTNGILLCNYKGAPLKEIQKSASTRNKPFTQSLGRRGLVGIIRQFEKMQHYSEILAVFLIGAVLVTTMMLLLLVSADMALIGLASLSFIAVMSGLFFLRLRMNRMLTVMEGRLARQQAAQFENLSERMKVLETTLSNDNND